MKRLDTAQLSCESQMSAAILLMCHLKNGEKNVILDISSPLWLCFSWILSGNLRETEFLYASK